MNKITLVENCEFPASPGFIFGERKLLRRLGQFRKRERKLLTRLSRANAGKSIYARRKAMRECQGSIAYRICSAVDANKKLPGKRRICLADLFEVADKLSWNVPTNEPVRVRGKTKLSGGERAICNPAIRNRTMDEALAKVLTVNFKPKPFQYEYGGKGGISQAIKDIASAVGHGYVWAARLDVHRCFESFDGEALYKWLPLRRSVIDAHVVGDHMNVVVTSTSLSIDEMIDQACRGVPQGSALSPKIAGMSVATLDWTSDLPLFNWVDDFLILGTTEEAVIEAAHTLIAKVSALPGGKFDLKLKSVCEANDGIVFLGHRIQIFEDQVEISPAFLDDFYGPLVAAELLICPSLYLPSFTPKLSKKEIFIVVADMWVFAKSWAQAFSACDDIDDYLLSVEQSVKGHLHALGLTFEALDGYKNFDAEWTKHYS